MLNAYINLMAIENLHKITSDNILLRVHCLMPHIIAYNFKNKDNFNHYYRSN